MKLERIIYLLAIIILIIFLWKSCNNPQPVPTVITGEQVMDTINLIDEEREQLNDSFALVKQKQDREIAKNKSEYDDLMAEYLNYQNDIESSLSNKKIPDTCKPIVAALSKQFDKLKTTSANKDKAASSTINSLTAKTKTQDAQLKEANKSYLKMKSIADTCSKSLTAMEKYAKQIKPKREINIGLSGMGNYAGNLNPAVGVTLGFRSKKGLDISASVYTNKVASVTLKKTLFKF